LIDSHAHLTAKQYRKDLAGVLRRAKEAGVSLIINVGYDVASSRAGLHLADLHDDVFAAVGVHPHDARTLDSDGLCCLEEMADHPKVVAIGEIGLDFHRNLSPRRSQERAFRQQIGLANRKGLPIVIHDRDAHRRTMAILRDEKVRDGVLHCFSGDINVARQGLDLGLYISFAGPVTYGGRKAVDIIRHIPIDRLLIETDCPYLAPVPFRGKRNEPAYVKYVLARLSEILGMPEQDLDRITEDNNRRLFRLAS
jgi:TatD DNase family protein